MAMLEIRDLEVCYGMIQAIKGISFEVKEGEVIALIGANGAGKTTTLHTVSGLLAPKAGSVIFEGKDITKIPAHKIVSYGMAHVPEGRRVFASLSVYQNLKMGAYTRNDKEEIEESLRMVYSRFPRLEERKNQPAGTLSGAPKIRACQLIGELEGTKRGIYGGCIGYLDFSGNMDMCIAIRLVYHKNGQVFVRSGAGIVADSDPEKEYEECLNKARSSLSALLQAQEDRL